MAYSAEISRRQPTAFLFVIDQSSSMGDRWGDGGTKAKATSDALNRLLYELITKCSKDEGVRHYFDVGVIGYGGTGPKDALAFVGGGILKPIPDLEKKPLRVEDRTMKIPDGAGGIVENKVKFPVWFDPIADGGTPMCQALKLAANEIAQWCDTRPDAFPPCVIHITDGESTDGDPEGVADVMKKLSTSDGNILLFNLHISSASAGKVIFPCRESDAPTGDAKKLFRMSSELPQLMVDAAKAKGYMAEAGARGYGYNADFTDLVSFFDIGTRAANLAR